MTQPEALALADILDRSVLQAHADAAAELRRLHESNTELLAAYQELLATLKELDAKPGFPSAWLKARAAIAKAESEGATP